MDKRIPPGSQSAISRTQKTHVHGVDIPEHYVEKITTLSGQESPEYRFGGPNFFQFLKEKRKNFAIFWIKGPRQVINKPSWEPKKTHAYGVDIPEYDGEIGSALGDRESPEYRFGSPNFFKFQKKKTQKGVLFVF